jgi:hypothetical protein
MKIADENIITSRNIPIFPASVFVKIKVSKNKFVDHSIFPSEKEFETSDHTLVSEFL